MQASTQHQKTLEGDAYAKRGCMVHRDSEMCVTKDVPTLGQCSDIFLLRAELLEVTAVSEPHLPGQGRDCELCSHSSLQGSNLL